MSLAKFECPKINLKLLVACFSEIRYLDLSNLTSSMFFQPPLEFRQVNGKKVHTQWGITWDEENIYITDTSINPENKKQLKSSILKLNINGQFIGELPFKNSSGQSETDRIFLQPHQLQYHKGYLFLVDTGHNCVKRIDCKTYQWIDIIPFPGRFGSDIDHINALSISDDKLYISSLGGRACIYEIDGEKYNCLRSMNFVHNIHNIFVLDCKVCVHHSEGGVIVNENGQSLLNIGPYNRGIIITDKYILSGQSALSERERRGDQKNIGRIAIFDRKTKKKLGQIIMPQAGQVLEIRCLNQLDYAHNGIIFEG